jgi:hypothetical protein
MNCLVLTASLALCPLSAAGQIMPAAKASTSKYMEPVVELLQGYFGLFLTWRDNKWKMRSLVFA